MTNRNKKNLSVLLKAVILLSSFAFIYYKLNNNRNLKNFSALVNKIELQQLNLTLVTLVLLMLANWVLEALKWRYLVRSIEVISLWKAIESVFCGLTLAVFTPNRIGEYGGRVFFLSPKRRSLGVVAMAVGATGQMVLTNVLGACALYWFFCNFTPFSSPVKIAWGFVALGFCLFFTLLYFNIRWLGRYLRRIKFLKKFRRFFSILERYERGDLVKVFLYCAARFFVFTSQYCLLIKMLIPEIVLFPMIMMVLILFFIQSALPSLDLLDVGVRTMTATYFFSFITKQEVAIMAATACIWLVNLVIPAILGSIFVFKVNFFSANKS